MILLLVNPQNKKHIPIQKKDYGKDYELEDVRKSEDKYLTVPKDSLQFFIEGAKEVKMDVFYRVGEPAENDIWSGKVWFLIQLSSRSCWLGTSTLLSALHPCDRNGESSLPTPGKKKNTVSTRPHRQAQERGGAGRAGGNVRQGGRHRAKAAARSG